MRYTVERIEDNIAVLEDEKGKLTEIPISLLPKNTKSGNILTFENEKYIFVADCNEEKRQIIFSKYQNILNKNKNKN